MNSKEFCWFKLNNVNGFGAKSIHYIMRTLKQSDADISTLFRSDINHLSQLFPELGKGKFSRANLNNLSALDEDLIIREYDKLKSGKIHIISLENDLYPKRLIDTMREDAPPLLFCKGYLPLLETLGISIVGSRDVDDFTVMLTRSIASSLAKAGFNVTSGYAKGVDTAAHLGALETDGTTTIILSHGINQAIVKSEMKKWDWEKNALFVSQFQPNEKFSGANAMIRNKLVCAMSQAIVVMASGPERDSNNRMSGTFDAAKSALKMGIPVFVLDPGVMQIPPIGNAQLIQLGAIPFSDGNTIVDFMKNYEEDQLALKKVNGTPWENQVGNSKKNDAGQLKMF